MLNLWLVEVLTSVNTLPLYFKKSFLPSTFLDIFFTFFFFSFSGSVNLLANLFQNCTNIAQITLNFCDLLQNNNFDVSDDDGIETDVNSAISQVQIVSALCKKIVKMLRDMSYDHNLAPPIAGQIHLNFPEAKTFDLPNEIVTNEETTAAQVAILQMKVTQSKVFEEIESDDGSEDNFGVVGDWGSDME